MSIHDLFFLQLLKKAHRGGEGKGRKEGKKESVAAHYSLGSSVGPHGSLACGWSVFVCVDFIM